jgi:hypothetical protein
VVVSVTILLFRSAGNDGVTHYQFLAWLREETTVTVQ